MPSLRDSRLCNLKYTRHAAYLQLLDWSGCLLSRGQRGVIPAELPPLLSRLGMSEVGRLHLAKDFDRCFRRAEGSPPSPSAEAARRDRQWLQDPRTAESVFTRSA